MYAKTGVFVPLLYCSSGPQIILLFYVFQVGSHAKLHDLSSVVTETSGINTKNRQQLKPELKYK